MDGLRLFSIRSVVRIDLRFNQLTAASADAITAWLVALPGSDLDRRAPLEIDLRNNRVFFFSFFLSFFSFFLFYSPFYYPFRTHIKHIYL